MSLLPDPATVYAAQTVGLATLTPSGNTVVERITIEALRGLPQVCAQFSRVPVHGTHDPSPEAYALPAFESAAALLAHARPRVLLWNGSKGCTIGFEHDRQLAARLQASTGIPTTSSTLALDAARQRLGLRRIGLVSPHVTPYQHKLIARLQAEGFEVVAEVHAGVADNLAYAAIPLPEIATMMRRVAAARPDAVLSLCTNFPGAPLCAALEAELGLPVLDTVTLGLWQALQQAGIDPAALAPRWGRVFAA